MVGSLSRPERQPEAEAGAPPPGRALLTQQAEQPTWVCGKQRCCLPPWAVFLGPHKDLLRVNQEVQLWQFHCILSMWCDLAISAEKLPNYRTEGSISAMQTLIRLLLLFVELEHLNKSWRCWYLGFFGRIMNELQSVFSLHRWPRAETSLLINCLVCFDEDWLYG